MSDAVFNMIEDDLNVEIVTEQLMQVVAKMYSSENIIANDVQQMMLGSHLKAMVERAKTLESLPEVDPSMFNDISPESIKLAKKIVNYLPTLHSSSTEEAYLLSVHIEVAKAN